MEQESHISRRSLLYKSTVVGTAIATAGCSSGDGGSSSDGGSSGDGGSSDKSTPDLVSQLDVGGFVTGDESTGDLLTQVEISNPTDQPVTADFSAIWEMKENEARVTSGTEEVTITAGSSQEFQLQMGNIDELSTKQYIGVYFTGFQMKIMADGETQGDLCSDTELTNSNSQGCDYSFGVLKTHIEVEYSGDWKGAAGGGGNTRTVSKQTSVVSTATDTSYVSISNGSSIISANAQKQEDSSETLTIRIVHKGEVVAEESTAAEYGVAQVSATV